MRKLVFHKVILPDGTTKIEKVPDTPEEIEAKNKNEEERKRLQNERRKVRNCHEKELVKKRGYDNWTNYRKDLAIKKGYKNLGEYQKEKNEELARKKGYENFSEYRKIRDNKWAEKKGFENYSEYKTNYNHTKGKHLPMDKSTESPSYLGVHIVERKIAILLLNEIFEKVDMMPYGNREFDSICNNAKREFVDRHFQFKLENDKEYKIQIKGASINKQDEMRADRWTFPIRRNESIDYFLLIAIDNRTNSNILYAWLIKDNEVIRGRKLSEFSTLSISNLTRSLRNLKRYEVPKDTLDKVNKLYKELIAKLANTGK